MKFLRALLVGTVAVGGCAGRMPEPKSPTMVRSFHGTLVPGYYVSPGAYEHYLRAQVVLVRARADVVARHQRPMEAPHHGRRLRLGHPAGATAHCDRTHQ